jgi:hypothetical protein
MCGNIRGLLTIMLPVLGCERRLPRHFLHSAPEQDATDNSWVMRFQITRLPSDDRVYSVVTENGTRYDFHDFELKQRLFNLGVGDSTVAAVLDAEPDATMTIQVGEAA